VAEAVLITGSTGMVGSHLVDRLRREGKEVVATHFRRTIDQGEVEKLRPLIELDVRNAAALNGIIESHRPQFVFHLAAQSYPTVSWEFPLETMDINIGGTVNLFEAIKAVRKRDAGYDPVVVVACSSAAYGASLRPESIPIREDVVLQPLHPYGVSKAGQDMLSYQYFVSDRIRAIRARIFNSTGPRKTNDVVSDFCARTADIMLHGGALRVGNLETRRAILDVADLVDALIRLAERGRPGEAYNICADQAYRVGDVIKILERLSGRTLDTTTDPALMRPTDEPIIFGDTTKIRTDTGWKPTSGLEPIVERVFRYELALRQALGRIPAGAS
jgi:GDP-4-dehydro-6-deoxy-D-mannose reductase